MTALLVIAFITIWFIPTVPETDDVDDHSELD